MRIHVKNNKFYLESDPQWWLLVEVGLRAMADYLKQNGNGEHDEAIETIESVIPIIQICPHQGENLQ